MYAFFFLVLSTGHGGSDGLHGYVPSLDHVVADTIAFLRWVADKHTGKPCFLFGHSTGGAIALKVLRIVCVHIWVC
jgi:acylglycerol lipase